MFESLTAYYHDCQSTPLSLFQAFLQRISFKNQSNDESTQNTLSSNNVEWLHLQTGDHLTYTNGQTNTIYYIQSGAVELRWEACLPVSLTTMFSQAFQWTTADHPSTPSTESSDPMDRIDSVAFTAPRVTNLTAIMAKQSTKKSHLGSAYIGKGNSNRSIPATSRKNTQEDNSRNLSDESSRQVRFHDNIEYFDTGMQQDGEGRSASEADGASASAEDVYDNDDQDEDPMQKTIIQATERAEALMENATGGSLDNLLLVQREACQFVGALSMLDPEFFSAKWRVKAVALTETVVIRMTRNGLDQFLSQNPLAQVHLRSSMALARSEVIKLESLERIANVYRKQLQRGGSGGGTKSSGIGGSKRLSDFNKILGVKDAAEVDAKPQKENGGHTAALDLFALVSKLRANF